MPIVTLYRSSSHQSNRIRSHASIPITIIINPTPQLRSVHPSMSMPEPHYPCYCCPSRIPSNSTHTLSPSAAAQRRAGCHLTLQLVEPNQPIEVDHPVGDPPCQSSNTFLHEPTLVTGWVRPPPHKGPCTRVEAKRRIIPWFTHRMMAL